MFGGVNRLEVRFFYLWAPSHILPLGYSQAGVVCTTLGFINEIDRCGKLLRSPLRGREGAREATAGAFVHTPVHAASEWVAVWES